ncbi:MAG TPA: endo-1,4-beta-xylanase [Firmicutes bacterium]|nr:endo-1,4-beta-xylanase [Bacillota bacterium]
MLSLKEVYRDYFQVGAAVNVPILEKRKDLIIQHFNTLTCENDMKYAGLCDQNGNYHFENADTLYQFAMENGIAMRGHNLVWHQAIPEKAFEEMSKEALEARICEHMQIVGARYPALSCWDVLNEAVDDKHGTYLRDTVWRRKFGDDYYFRVYEMAREYLPGMQLVYNDYNEFMPEKRKYILQFVTELKERGLVDAIGLQCHISVYSSYHLDEVRRTYELFAKLGLRLHVTELDVALPEIVDPTVYTEAPPALVEKQAQIYQELFAVFREYHEVIDSVTLWGVSDDQSWFNYFMHKRENWPLLFDKNGEPKEVFYRITQF